MSRYTKGRRPVNIWNCATRVCLTACTNIMAMSPAQRLDSRNDPTPKNMRTKRRQNKFVFTKQNYSAQVTMKS